MLRENLRETLLQPAAHRDVLSEAMQELCSRMQAVDSRFAEETDGDLLDAYIYERLALQAHYRYLTRQMRERPTGQQA